MCVVVEVRVVGDPSVFGMELEHEASRRGEITTEGRQ